MSLRAFALTLALGIGVASAAGLVALSTSAPAAVPGNDGKESPVAAPAADAALRRNGSADACRQAAWPYVPAGCLRSADPERQARPVRIIQIYSAPHRS
jgi:hypothetical protein